MTALQTITNGTKDAASFRADRAARIKELSRAWAENSIALGIEFREARDSFPSGNGPQANRPGWEKWVKDNTGWTVNHAARFVRIAEKFDHLHGEQMPNLSFRVFEFLAKEAMPDEGVREVINRAKAGEALSLGQVKEIVRPHLPTPAQARKQARDTGKLVAASDGNIYSGATIDEERAYSERRSIVYGMRRSVDFIADCELAPKQWIDSTEDAPHWINEFRLANVDAAIKWLTKFRPLLEKKLGVING